MILNALIEQEKQKILFGNVMVATISAVATEIAVGAVLWNSLSHFLILSWFGYMLFCTAVQLVGVFARKMEPFKSKKWPLYCYFSGCITEAVGWAIGIHALFPDNLHLQAFLIIVLVCVAIAALPIFCAYFFLYMGYALVIMVGISTKFAFLNAPTGFTLFILSLFLMWILFDLGKRYSETLEASLKLRFENEDLAHRTLLAKEQVESANQELSSEIVARKKAQEHLKEAKEKAEAANRAKGNFLSNVSHELRTPLNAIIGYSELLQDEVSDIGGMDGLLPDLDRIRKSGKHLLSMIEEVLELSKSESDHTNLKPSCVDLLALLDEISATIDPIIQKNGNVLEVKVPEGFDSFQITTDETKLRQILLNLLSNAAKFTQQGKIQFLVEAQRAGDPAAQLLFKVIDTGIGISQEALPCLFEPFFQAQNSHGGTGLGLAISQNYAKLLGGTLCVTSQKGQGSTFELTLPVTPTPTHG